MSKIIDNTRDLATVFRKTMESVEALHETVNTLNEQFERLERYVYGMEIMDKILEDAENRQQETEAKI